MKWLYVGLSTTAIFALLWSIDGQSQATERGGFPERPDPVDQRSAREEPLWDRLETVMGVESSPRFAFYWGEWLSSDIEERSQAVVEGRVRSEGEGHHGFDPQYSDYWEAGYRSEGEFRIVERDEVVSEQRTTPLVGAALWQVESAFVSVLSPLGVRLIDPGLAIRKQSGQQREQTDRRRLETDAILEDATHVLEVLGRRDRASESGWLYRVRVTDISSGHRVIDFTTDAIPDVETERRYIATEGGFELLDPPAAAAEDIGVELARQLALRLVEIEE